MGGGDVAVACISLGDERQGSNGGSGAGTGVREAPDPEAGATASASAFRVVAGGNLSVNSRRSH